MKGFKKLKPRNEGAKKKKYIESKKIWSVFTSPPPCLESYRSAACMPAAFTSDAISSNRSNAAKHEYHVIVPRLADPKSLLIGRNF
jgi:hypothetical protein